MPSVSKYQDSIADAQTGRPLRNIEVVVKLAGSSTLATRWNSNGTTEDTSDILTDSNGYFSFYVIAGNYDIYVTIGDTTRTLTDVRIGELFDIDQDTPFNNVTRIRHGFNNFLGNSNFEVWLNGTTSVPSAWTLQGDATIARSSTATAGSYSAQITFGTANSGELYQSIPTNTVVDYTLSCYVQRLSGSGRARLVAQQADSPYTEFASVELPTASGWHLCALTVKPAAGASMRFAIKSYDAVASVWLVDECMFEESKGVASTWSAAALNDTSNQNVWGIQYFKQPPELQAGAILTVPTYANNSLAIAGGLSAGTLYKTSAGAVMVVY